jgi:hypothetical protein
MTWLDLIEDVLYLCHAYKLVVLVNLVLLCTRDFEIQLQIAQDYMQKALQPF